MSWREKLILGVVLTLYACLGLIHSSHQGFWHDEIYTLTFLNGISVYDFEGSAWTYLNNEFNVQAFKELLSEDNFFKNFQTQILHEGHPPLYFILLKFWSYAFGTSEIALRGFSLCCGILVLLVFYQLFRSHSKNRYVPWLLLLLLILNPFLFYFFTEARMYALALLLSTISFSSWLNYQNERQIKSLSFLLFSISSIGLLYTHYYGIFFLTSLGLYELLKYGFRTSLLNHLIPVALFIPWGFQVQKQLNFHTVHWTDGSVSVFDSTVGFLDGLVHTLISPGSDFTDYELIIIVSLFTLISFLYFKRDGWTSTIVILTIMFYGAQILVFDQLIDHHSILVPRYYLFVLVFVYWFLFSAFNLISKPWSFLVVFLIGIASGNVLKQIFYLERAPKEMFKEVAVFIDKQFEPEKRILVFEPKGPLVFGVAYYLGGDFEMALAPDDSNKSEKSAVYIDERLGLAYKENQFNSAQQENLELIPFVGVALYK